MPKIYIEYPIIVEGKYDKNTLSQIFDANIITLGGFEIFNSKQKQALIRKLGSCGIILLTDSDSAGNVIRSFIKGIIPHEKLFNVYVPQIAGKEKRKKTPSKEGYLGVEGMSRDVLVNALMPFAKEQGRDGKNSDKCKEKVTKTHFYIDGFSGGQGSKSDRDRLCEYFGLPKGMSANSLLAAINILTDVEGYKEAARFIRTFEKTN